MRAMITGQVGMDKKEYIAAAEQLAGSVASRSMSSMSAT